MLPYGYRTLLMAIALLALTTALPGQPGIGGWFGDDGLNAGCCVPVATTNLPSFPSFQQDGRAACFLNCNLESDDPVVVTMNHLPIACDYALIFVTISPSSTTAPGWTGTLLAKYSRTWTEPSPFGIERQVWRFLVNGELTPTSGNVPCPLPPHANDPSHFQGHVDYACDFDPTNPNVPIFRMAMSLSHLPGCISHHPLSGHPLPGTLSHPDRSYHVVSPGASWTWAPVPIPVGPLAGEAARSNGPIFGYQCLGEGNPIVMGALTLTGFNCPCALGPPGPFAWADQGLTGTVPCVGAVFPFATFPLFPPLPPAPSGLITMPLGFWTGPPGVFPENRDLLIHWGVLQYQDPCNAAGFPLHVVSGVSTANHPSFVFAIPGVVFNVTMDLGNKLLPNGLLGPFTIGWGAPSFSTVVWNLNLP